MTILRALLHEEQGFVISTELVVVATLLVVGLITGIQCVQSAVVAELKDVAAAIGSLNQSYCFTGKHGCWTWFCGPTSWTAGSCFVDCVDEIHEPIDFGCVVFEPCPPDAALLPHPAPVLEDPHAECPPMEDIPQPCTCPPTGQPACDACHGTGNVTCLPGDCPPPVPCPGHPDSNGAAPVHPVIW